MSDSPFLADVIRNEIHRNGPLPFERFMELALYHPKYGYYASRPGAQAGRKGDFYTSVSIGSVFGEVLASQFAEMWEYLHRPDPFTIIEQGANTGHFAADVLYWLQQHRPEIFIATRYHFIEPLRALEDRQRQNLAAAGVADSGRWSSDFSTLHSNPGTGVFFSNELVDSFPVHQIIKRDGHWQEIAVDWNQDRFVATTVALSASLQERIKALPESLPEGYTTELHERSRQWMNDAARCLRCGWILTIDYGFPEDVYYAASRTEGTLRAYHQHQKSTDLLARAGEQDLTAHVNFTALIESGKNAGLEVAGLTDQHHFLTGAARPLLEHIERSGMQDKRTGILIRQLKTLLHPEVMGTAFQVLIQTRNVPRETPLQGLSLARPTY